MRHSSGSGQEHGISNSGRVAPSRFFNNTCGSMPMASETKEASCVHQILGGLPLIGICEIRHLLVFLTQRLLYFAKDEQMNIT